MEQNGPHPDPTCYDAAIAACEMSSQFSHAVIPISREHGYLTIFSPPHEMNLKNVAASQFSLQKSCKLFRFNFLGFRTLGSNPR